MIKNGYINIYGVYTESYIEGEALACPHCRRIGTASVLRELEFEPPIIRIKCTSCGYVTPEVYSVYNSDFAKGVSEALDVWNNLSMIKEIENAEEEYKNSLEVELEDEE